MKKDKIMLHLGCGNIKLPNFINIDCRYLPSVDRIENIKYLRSFDLNSVDMIYSSHVLEHFSRHDYKHILSRWFELLKSGGVLRIAVPDFESIVNRYIKTKDLEELIGLLYGGQDYKENFHHYIWDFNLLEKDLKNIGFKEIKKYNSLNTEYSNIHDCSQAFLPKMDKINGELMSLNIEAIK
jgi:hypothetical protein